MDRTWQADQLCEVLEGGSTGDGINAKTSAFGYSVPSADVPAAQARRVTARQIRQMFPHKPA